MWRRAKLVIVILCVGLAMAGVTRMPGPGPEQREGEAPPEAQGPAAGTTVQSSTRGQVVMQVEPATRGGRPYNPGGQAVAARRLSSSSSSAGSAPAPVASAESVIGADGRVSLPGPSTAYPNSAIGRIDFRQGGHNYWCTGVLIDADTVLTAGHCVHDGRGGSDGWSAQVRFLPGVRGNVAPFGSCAARELLTLSGWVSGGSEYHDLGLVHLDCSIGETVGWFGYGPMPKGRSLIDVPVQVRGYPADKPWSTLWTMRDRVRATDRLMAFYATDTYGGQSGAPVFNLRPCNGAQGPCVLAVHAYGTHPGGRHAVLNHGPRLTPRRTGLVAMLAAT